MHVSIKLFATLKDLACAPVIAVEAAEGSTVADLRAAVAKAVPALAELVASAQGGVRVAAALQFVAEDHVLVPGEDLALIPPVGGG